MYKVAVSLLFVLLCFSLAAATVDDVVITQLWVDDTVPVVVQLVDDAQDLNSLEAVAKRHREQHAVLDGLDDEFSLKTQYGAINGFAGEVSAEGLLALVDDPRVVAVEHDAELSLFVEDAVPLLNGTLVHNLSLTDDFLTGLGQSVCVIDSGVNSSVDSLAGAVVHEQCFCSVSDYGNGGCCAGGYPTSSSALDDDGSAALGHGTRVSSIIAGNSTLTGVAPGANIVMIKAFDQDRSALVSDTLSALDYCVQNKSLFNIAAVSMSFGTSLLYSSACDDFSSYSSYVNAAVAVNITPVAATGNAGSTTGIAAPSCVANVTSVASSTKTYGVSSFSNRNAITDLIAPGSSITSTTRFNANSASSGTSYSAPLVSGAVALLQQYKIYERGYPLSPAEVRDVLVSTAVDIVDDSLTLKQPDLYAALLSIDALAPSLAVTSLEDGAFYSDNSSLALNYVATDVFFDTAWYHFGSAANTTLTSNLSLFLEEGLHDLFVYANDTAGNVAAQTFSFEVNLTSAPVVALESPAADYVSSSSSVNFNCSVADSDGLVSLSFLHNASGSFAVNVTEEDDGTYYSSIFTAPFADGSYLWGCRAVDAHLLLAYAPTNRTVVVDTNGPDVVLTGPENSSFDADGIVTATYTVTDALSAIGACSLYVDGVVDSTDVLASGSFVSTQSEGAHDWFVSCFDALGHNTNSSVQSFNVDTSGPNVTLVAPANLTTDDDGVIDFSYTVADVYSNLSSCSLYVNDAFDQEDLSPTVNGTFTDTVSNGGYTWFVSCIDALGHGTNSSVREFTVSIPAPSSSPSTGGGGGGGGGGSSSSRTTPAGNAVVGTTPASPRTTSTSAVVTSADSVSTPTESDDSGLGAVTGEAVADFEEPGSSWWMWLLLLFVLGGLGGLGYYYRDALLAAWKDRGKKEKSADFSSL